MSSREDSRLNPLLVFTEQWLELWQQANTLGNRSLQAMPHAYDPRQVRNLWLTELSSATNRYMRSAAFLDVVHFNLAAMSNATRFFSPFRFR